MEVGEIDKQVKVLWEDSPCASGRSERPLVIPSTFEHIFDLLSQRKSSRRQPFMLLVVNHSVI